ncbi:MAG TPA: phasin family protein [Hyphomicrobiaceae bacterium]|nr:phasin family protein [Hyphomicrobiaceae bacterium]
MKEDFARQASEMFDAAKTARIPDNVQAFAEESVAKTRETYRMINTLAKDGAKVLEDVVLTAQAGAKALGEKVMTNANTNVETAFDAARAIARARTLPEVACIQGDLMHHQLAVANTQTKELLDLSTNIAMQTLKTVNAAVTKTFEDLSKGAKADHPYPTAQSRR